MVSVPEMMPGSGVVVLLVVLDVSVDVVLSVKVLVKDVEVRVTGVEVVVVAVVVFPKKVDVVEVDQVESSVNDAAVTSTTQCAVVSTQVGEVNSGGASEALEASPKYHSAGCQTRVPPSNAESPLCNSARLACATAR